MERFVGQSNPLTSLWWMLEVVLKMVSTKEAFTISLDPVAPSNGVLRFGEVSLFKVEAQ